MDYALSLIHAHHLPNATRFIEPVVPKKVSQCMHVSLIVVPNEVRYEKINLTLRLVQSMLLSCTWFLWAL